MIVGGLERDPRRPESTLVVVAGRPAWTVPADVVQSLGLRVGERFPTGASEILDRAADEEGALRAALRLLERRAHGRRELVGKLARRAHTDAAVEGAIRRLERLGLIDDAAFAEQYVIARAGRGWGPRRLGGDLAALGIDNSVAAAVIRRLTTDLEIDPWGETLAVAERRAASMAHLSRSARQRRLTAFFLRRGYGDERVRAAVGRLIAGA